MLRRHFPLVLALLVSITASTPEVAQAEFAHLTLQSESGDFVGQGRSFDIIYDSAAGATVSSRVSSGRLVDGEPGFLEFVLDRNIGTNTFAALDFATDRIPLAFQAGTFPDAQRASFAAPGFAGLDVVFQSRGSNIVSGSFTVNSVSFYRDLSDRLRIGSLDVSFVQRSELPTNPALRGRFQYNAVPEPSTLVLLGLGCLGLVARARVAQALRGGPRNLA